MLDSTIGEDSPHMTFEFLTTKEVADFLRVSTRTVFTWCAYEGLPHHKIGGHLRFDPQALDKWISDRVRSPRTSA